MKHTKYRLFFSWDYQKEEQWLNDMSNKGLHLVHTGLCKYVFEENLEDHYIYRIELLDHLPTTSESIAYIQFLEETGVEHVDSLLRWVYFRKKACDGEFEIYSDIDSKIQHYKRIRFIICVTIPLTLFNIYNMSTIYLRTKSALYASIAVLFWILIVLIGIGVFKISGQIKKLKKDHYIKE